MEILSGLNSQQRQAVERTEGPVVIIAGPGTGKTKTLVHRIAHLLAVKNIQAENILALTFTKKAANEMQERLQSMVGQDTRLPFIGTFHSLGYEILASQAAQETLSVIDEDARSEIVTTLANTFPANTLSKKDLLLEISRYKNSLPDENTLSPYNLIISAYNHALSDKNLLDYDDLILSTYQLLSDDESLRRRLQQEYRYILIDEFQDTSPLQYELAKLLLNQQKNIFVIGDPLQSIYSFRGASARSFELFEQDFPECDKITLQTNYRSTADIIDASQALFPAAPKLSAFNSHKGLVQHVLTFNEYTEADWIISKINKLMGGTEFHHMGSGLPEGENQTQFSDFALIYRTHAVARTLRKKFRESTIPFQSVGGDSLYEQKEIQLLIDCLQMIKSKDVRVFHMICTRYKKHIIPDHQDILLSLPSDLTLPALGEKIISILNLRSQLEKEPDKLADLAEFCNSLLPYENDPGGLDNFLAYVERLKENEFFDYQADKVALLTMHASKGLQFRHVFIIGCEDGIIPYVRKNEEPNIAEEKRLLYVALTRAKQNAYLLTCQKRNGYSERIASPFIQELPDTLYRGEIDPAIARIEKKIEKRKKQQQQMKLF